MYNTFGNARELRKAVKNDIMIRYFSISKMARSSKNDNDSSNMRKTQKLNIERKCQKQTKRASRIASLERKRQVHHGFFSKVFGMIIIGLGLTGMSAQASEGIKRNFTLTGYYSPLPNQDFYITGSYEAEKRLNGEGLRGADGTEVYPGMIAAPSTYAFGTKICLPNFGCGVVHDRGGAIVHKGERNLAQHDRLDLWMGYGEEGLLRALQLGVDHVTGTLYPRNANVNIAVNFQSVTPIGQVLELPDKIYFSENLYIGVQNTTEVKKLQESLKKLGLFDGSISGLFELETKEAIVNFQIKNFILESANDYGAGSFGPQTRKKFEEVLYKKIVQQKVAEKWASFNFEKNIKKGKRSPDVLLLQEVLIQQEFMKHQATGYFGNVTKSALIEFQIAHEIIKNEYSNGAGNVGPMTREKLNEILSIKKENNQKEKDQIFAYQKNQNQLNYFAGKVTSNFMAQK